MKIVKRNLTLKEAELISAEIKPTNNIIAYRPNELIQLKDIFILTEKGKLIGILAYVELKEWIDLKIFLILENNRGKGYGKNLFNYALLKLQQSNKSIYTITRNPIVISLLKSKGFSETNLLKLPLTVKLHQSKMLLNSYRLKEYIRKLIKFRSKSRFKCFELNYYRHL